MHKNGQYKIRIVQLYVTAGNTINSVMA